MESEELKEYMDRIFNGLADRKNEIDNILKTLKGIDINALDKTNDYLLMDLILFAFDEVSISKNCIKMLMKKELDSIMNSVYYKLSAVDCKITDISLNKKTISEEDRKYYSEQEVEFINKVIEDESRKLDNGMVLVNLDLSEETIALLEAYKAANNMTFEEAIIDILKKCIEKDEEK